MLSRSGHNHYTGTIILLVATIRRTASLEITELSVVDSPANPSCHFSLVKVLGGVPVASDILMNAGEEQMEKAVSAAVSIERVASVLAAGCRPLAAEMTAALKNLYKCGAGTRIVACDATQTRDYAANGIEWASHLRRLAAGLRVAKDEATRCKIAKATEKLLNEFVQVGKSASTSNSEHRSQSAAPKRLLTLDELCEMENKLSKQLDDWNQRRLPQNNKEFEILSRTFMKVSAMVKRAEGRAARFGRR